jgi:tRNA threonylcarbamoyladenosine biosynthesis protein TsaB
MPATHTIFIETSTPQASIGLFHDSWQQVDFTSERSHNCEIFTPLESLIAPIAVGTIEKIIVGTGPGSYSGTRVGIATAQGLAIAHDCPVIGLPSILAVPSARSMGDCLAIGDARRGDWWWARIDAGKLVHEPEMGSIEKLLDIVQSESRLVFSLDEIAPDVLGRVILREIPTAKGLWESWQQLSLEEKELYAHNPVQPVYLKPPHITAAKPGHPLQRESQRGKC